MGVPGPAGRAKLCQSEVNLIPGSRSSKFLLFSFLLQSLWLTPSQLSSQSEIELQSNTVYALSFDSFNVSFTDQSPGCFRVGLQVNV